MGLEWFDDGKSSGYRKVEPKPFEQIPLGEQDPKKALTITNHFPVSFAFGQIGSTWDTVNFVVYPFEFESKEIRWLATLEPNDKLQLDFHPSKKIEP